MYSVQVAVSDGTLTRIALSIEYFEKDDITLYRNLELTPLVLDTDWRWDGDTHIELLTNTPVPLGSYITVRRNTNIDRAFNIYDGGAPFSRDTLDENFRQMIYLAQEFTEGNGLTGLFFPLDMHGFQIKNLGDGTAPGDAVNKGQLDVVDDRITSLEGTYIKVTASYPWYTITTETTDTLVPGLNFDKAALYLNGVCQTPNYSYIVVSNTIVLATPVPPGTMVFARLGEDVPDENGWATTSQLTALQGTLQGNIDGKANKGANSDITSLSGLTTPLSVSQGGLGASTPAGGRTNLGATATGSALFTAEDAVAGRAALGLGTSSTRDVGTTSLTVLPGNAVGRLIAVQRFTTAGTYTPTPGMTSCVIEAVGGGGAGGGSAVTSASTVSGGAGGNGGAFARVLCTAAQIGTSRAVTVGAGGAPATGALGGNGGDTTITGVLTCPGGIGGAVLPATNPVSGGLFVQPSARTTPSITLGTMLALQQSEQSNALVFTTTGLVASAGGDTPLGSGGAAVLNAAGTNATVGVGGGGSGAMANTNVATTRAGGAGASGLITIYEYS